MFASTPFPIPSSKRPLPPSSASPPSGSADPTCICSHILPLLTDDDPLGVEAFATHKVPLSEGPAAYEAPQKKQDGAVKVLSTP